MQSDIKAILEQATAEASGGRSKCEIFALYSPTLSATGQKKLARRLSQISDHAVPGMSAWLPRCLGGYCFLQSMALLDIALTYHANSPRQANFATHAIFFIGAVLYGWLGFGAFQRRGPSYFTVIMLFSTVGMALLPWHSHHFLSDGAVSFFIQAGLIGASWKVRRDFFPDLTAFGNARRSASGNYLFQR